MGRCIGAARLKSAQLYLASFASGDPDAVAEHVHPDFENVHLGVLGAGCTGKTAYRERLAGFLSEFREIDYEVHALLGDGDAAACRYTFHFTREGRRFAVPGMMWFELCGDMIRRRYDCWDGLQFAQQAGMGPPALASLIGADGK